MEYIKITGTDIKASRIIFGTWAIGGYMWGGTHEEDAIKTIEKALDIGINMLDTAPVYGLGHSEEMIGNVVKGRGIRDKIYITSKVGLEWFDDGTIFTNCDKKRMQKEIEDSLRRLQTDYIDLYQVHWPDTLESFSETAEIMSNFKKQGKIRAIGVSNFSIEQMDEFKSVVDINTVQPQYNIFERAIEDDVLPYCLENNLTTLLYSNLCRGMLSGKMSASRELSGDDLRQRDPKFIQPRFSQYLAAVEKLDQYAREKYDKRVIHLAVRWALDQPGCGISIWGARKPSQMDAVLDMMDWHFTEEDIRAINKIVEEEVTDPIGPEFLLPPNRNEI